VAGDQHFDQQHSLDSGKEKIMDLLDRYLQAVRKHLPWNRQDDILAELRANLESQLEEHEEALGRPLTQAEAEAWLKEIGPPIQVAGRYLPQQSLIGPSIFPIYWWVLRTAMIWGFGILVIVAAIQIMAAGFATDSARVDASLRAVWPALLNIPFALMQIAAWITLAFAAFEFAIAQGLIQWPSNEMLPEAISANWSPSKLPPIEQNAGPESKVRTRVKAIAELVLGILVVIWMLLFPSFPVLVLGPSAHYLDLWHFGLTETCVRFYWCIVVLNIVQVVWNGYVLALGRWQESQLGRHLVFKLFGIMALSVLLTAPDQILLFLRDPAADTAKYGVMVGAINHWSHVGLSIGLAMSILQLGWDTLQWLLAIYRSRPAVIR
jgi:hypothetical protein